MLQAREIQQRFSHIQQTIQEAEKVCRSGDAPDDLKKRTPREVESCAIVREERAAAVSAKSAMPTAITSLAVSAAVWPLLHFLY